MIYNSGPFVLAKAKDLYTFTVIDDKCRNVQWKYEDGGPVRFYGEELVQLRDLLDKIVNEDFGEK